MRLIGLWVLKEIPAITVRVQRSDASARSILRFVSRGLIRGLDAFGRGDLTFQSDQV